MYLKFLISVFCLILIHSSYAQLGKRSLIGKYESQKLTNQIALIDTVKMFGDSLPIVPMTVFEIDEFQARTLILKRYNKVELINNVPITCLGLNIDNPTIYGKFKIVGDSIFIHAKYSIQHFNKLAPKRRVKTKVDKTYVFKIINENQFMVSPNYSWIKNTFYNN